MSRRHCGHFFRDFMFLSRQFNPNRLYFSLCIARHASPLAAPARAADVRSRVAPQPPAPTSGYKRKVSPIAIPESPPPAVQSGGISPPAQPSFNWPVVHSARVVRINGDNVGIRGISFDSTGQYLAVNCALFFSLIPSRTLDENCAY